MKMMATAKISRMMTTTIDRPISQARLPIKQAGLTQFLFVFNEMGPGSSGCLSMEDDGPSRPG